MEVHVSLKAETLFHLGPLPVTNSFVTMLIVMALLILVCGRIARRATLVPGRAQAAYELIVEFLLGLVDGTAGREAGRKMFPLIGAIFIFIAIANYTGILPGVGTIGFWEHETPAMEAGTSALRTAPLEVAAVGPVAAAPAVAASEEGGKVLVPFLRAPNADLNMTLAMALVTFVIVQILGIRSHGVGGRIKHMANPPFLFPIEVVSELSRIISLSARLFGNVVAGEILLGVMYSMAVAVKVALVPFAIPVVFIGLEILFGTIQALVFALLSMIYIVLATEGGHGDEHGHAAAPDAHPAGGAQPLPSGSGD